MDGIIPRLPTVAGLRRRGYPQTLSGNFVIGLASQSGTPLQITICWNFVSARILNKTAQRRIAVLKPLRVIITNYGQEFTENIVLENLPGEEAEGSREVPFTRSYGSSRTIFMEHPTKNYFRLNFRRSSQVERSIYHLMWTHAVKDERWKHLRTSL